MKIYQNKRVVGAFLMIFSGIFSINANHISQIIKPSLQELNTPFMNSLKMEPKVVTSIVRRSINQVINPLDTNKYKILGTNGQIVGDRSMVMVSNHRILQTTIQDQKDHQEKNKKRGIITFIWDDGSEIVDNQQFPDDQDLQDTNQNFQFNPIFDSQRVQQPSFLLSIGQSSTYLLPTKFLTTTSPIEKQATTDTNSLSLPQYLSPPHIDSHDLSSGALLSSLNIKKLDPFCQRYENSQCTQCNINFYLDLHYLCQAACLNFHPESHQCQLCQSGFIIKNGQCVSDDVECLLRDQKGKCQSCKNGYQFEKGRCTVQVQSKSKTSNIPLLNGKHQLKKQKDSKITIQFEGLKPLSISLKN